MYIPNARYRYRKSVFALLSDLWHVMSYMVFMGAIFVVVGFLMRLGLLVWVFISLFFVPFVLRLSKTVFDWVVDAYEIRGSTLYTTQRTVFQTLQTDDIPLVAVRNVEMRLSGVLGETLKWVGDVRVIVEGMGAVDLVQVGEPERVRNTIMEAAEYWRDRK